MQLPKVKISQFYGIELNSFAVKVLKVSFLLAELQLTGQIVDINDLEKHILTANALRMDWNDLLANKDCNYIISNPPFAGKKTKDQLKDMKLCFSKTSLKYGVLDYVTSWYKKAADYIYGTLTQCCLLSTSSVVQGMQSAILWGYLEREGIYINFAYKSFKWKNSLPGKMAQVFVVIISFSYKESLVKKIYQTDENNKVTCENVSYINGYLLKDRCQYVNNLKLPLDKRQKMYNGIDYIDNQNYKLSSKEKEQLLRKEPFSKEYIHPYFNGKDLLNGKTNFCLWFKDKKLFDLKKCPTILNRVKKVREYRNKCGVDTKMYANKPLLPTRLRYYSNHVLKKLLIFSSTFSNAYEYIPAKYVSKGSIVTHSIMLIPDGSLFTFGIIESKIHMMWTKRFAGRLGDAISYSNGTVYNTFPWPNPTDEQKSRIEKTAQGILDARNLHKDCTLAQLYNPLTMPSELRKAHKLNDEAVLKAFGFSKNAKEEEIVAKLMEMYKKLIDKENT